MKNANEVRGLLSQVKEAATKVKARINELDDQIEALYARRNMLLSGALSKADYLATVRADVQGKARHFVRDMRRHLLRREREVVNFPATRHAAGGELPIRYLDAGVNLAVPMTEGAYYFYFEDQIVAGIERLLEGAHEWPDGAVPVAEREATLADLDAQIGTLTAERDALANDLVACGVTQ